MQHLDYMQLALKEARKSPPKPTNFCVGALLVSPSSRPSTILATGFTLELPGNTHAEQCCFSKFAQDHKVSEEDIGSILPHDSVLYTTMEPCSFRLSGSLPCTDRILRTLAKPSDRVEGSSMGIRKIYVGVLEPDTFVGDNNGRGRLEDAGVQVIRVAGLEDEILAVATAGHEK